MANEQKAKEIAQSVSFFWTNEDDCEKSIIDTVSLRKAIFNAALQAMQWKDEQHKQEKQKLIDKAESVCAEMFLRIESELFNAGVKNTNNRKEIEDALEIGYKYFKQAMKGE